MAKTPNFIDPDAEDTLTGLALEAARGPRRPNAADHLLEHRFKPGNSGNATPRAKSLVAAIREAVPPERLLQLFESIAFDESAARKDRMEAAKWLSDHGYGKAPETHVLAALPAESAETAVTLSREQLLALTDLPSPGGGLLGTGLQTPALASQATVDATPVGQVPDDTDETD